jgi:hypothetical protein
MTADKQYQPETLTPEARQMIFTQKMWEVEAENERRWKALAARYPGQVPTTPAEIFDFLASEYGWTLRDIAGLSGLQTYAFINAALRRRSAAAVQPSASENTDRHGEPASRPHEEAQEAKTDHSERRVVRMDRWSDLGVGLDGERRIWAFTPCPENWERVAVRKAICLDLPGKRWRHVLQLLAESKDGKTARVSDLVTQLGFAKKIGRAIPDEQAVYDEGLLRKAKRSTRALRNAMADLGRELRNQVTADDDCSTPFRKVGETYQAAFTAGFLLENEGGQRQFVFGPTC